MTVNEAMQYCQLRAEGAGLFERDKQEALRWYLAYEELKDASERGYGPWQVEDVLAPAQEERGLIAPTSPPAKERRTSGPV